MEPRPHRSCAANLPRRSNRSPRYDRYVGYDRYDGWPHLLESLAAFVREGAVAVEGRVVGVEGDRLAQRVRRRLARPNQWREVDGRIVCCAC